MIKVRAGGSEWSARGSPSLVKMSFEDHVGGSDNWTGCLIHSLPCSLLGYWWNWDLTGLSEKLKTRVQTRLSLWCVSIDNRGEEGLETPRVPHSYVTQDLWHGHIAHCAPIVFTAQKACNTYERLKRHWLTLTLARVLLLGRNLAGYVFKLANYWAICSFCENRLV